MRHANLPILAAILSATCSAHPAAQSIGEPETRITVSLRYGDREITAVRIRNTGSRTFTDDSSNRTCSLSAEKQGVIWVIVLEGKDIPVAELTFRDERNRSFEAACWSEKITGIFARNRVGETLTFVSGPADSRTINVRFADASVNVDVGKGEGQR